ncbi:MAG: hypothetical protein AAFW60_07105, partial [Pseudomonadota bacterium]
AGQGQRAERGRREQFFHHDRVSSTEGNFDLLYMCVAKASLNKGATVSPRLISLHCENYQQTQVDSSECLTRLICGRNSRASVSI